MSLAPTAFLHGGLMGVHRLIPRDWSFARAGWDVLYSGMVHLLSLHLVPGILDPRPHESIWRSLGRWSVC